MPSRTAPKPAKPKPASRAASPAAPVPAATPQTSMLGAKIRELRHARQWSSIKLAKLAGIAQSTLSKVENGRLSLSYEQLMNVANALEVEISELFAPQALEQRALPSSGLARRSVVGTGADGLPAGQHMATANYEQVFLCSDLLQKAMVPVFVQVRARSLEEFGPLLRHAGEEFLFVLKGSIDVHTEIYAPVRLTQHQGVYIDSAMGHAYTRAGEGDAWILRVHTTARPGPAAKAPLDAAARAFDLLGGKR